MEENNAVQSEKIKNNERRVLWLEEHYSTFNDEMGSVKQDVATIKTDVNWLKKSHWMVVGASVGAVIAAIANIIIK